MKQNAKTFKEHVTRHTFFLAKSQANAHEQGMFEKAEEKPFECVGL